MFISAGFRVPKLNKTYKLQPFVLRRPSGKGKHCHCQPMEGDLASKPDQLRKLLKNHVPDKAQSYFYPSELSTVMSRIRAHKLLSINYEEPRDEKIVEDWKAVMDAWNDRLMMLLCESTPVKCWAGVCLVGLTCLECSSDHFLVSYSGWFQKLQKHMQESTKSQYVKMASCASLAVLLTRLREVSKLERDGTHLAGKLIGPLLELLREERIEAIVDGAIHLLFAVLISFPSAIHRHYDKIEAAIASKVLSGEGSDGSSKKLVQFLAALPKSRGDKDSWCLLMQKILLSINEYLNDAFRGLEEGSMNDDVFRLLVPPGQKPPPPLGKGDAIAKCMRRSRQMLMSRLTTLMHCCREMLTYSYPVQVALPVRPLLTLVKRVLMMDGSVPHNLLLVTAPPQELILSLHSRGLDLLFILIKAWCSQILPDAPYIARFITRYFKICTLPELRIKVYSVIELLLSSMRSGGAIFFGQAVVDGASLDLNPEVGTGNEFGISQSNEDRVSLSPNCGKRKRASVSTTDKHERGELASKDHQTFAVKIAALQAIEALLKVALKSESWRSKVRELLISVATNIMKKRCSNEGNRSCFPDEAASAQQKLRLAALHTLSVSFLTQGDWPPQYIAKTLGLFRRGWRQTGTEIGDMGGSIISSVEVSFEKSLREFLANGHTSRMQQKKAHSIDRQIKGFGLPDSDDDELHKIHLQNVIGNDYLEKNLNDTRESPHKAEKHSNDIPLVKHDPGKVEMALSAADVDVSGRRISKEIRVNSLQHEDTTAGDQKSVPDESIMILCIRSANDSAENLSEMDVSAEDVNHADKKARADEHALGSKETVGNLAVAGKGLMTTLRPDEGRKLLIDSDNESSMGMFPDIVDADPDTDGD